MKKLITNLSYDPLSISLSDRKHSLFIDPVSANIFVDEGDGDDRMNGAVFLPAKSPLFSVQKEGEGEYSLVLNYRGIRCVAGQNVDRDYLERWAESANSVLAKKRIEIETAHSELQQKRAVAAVAKDALTEPATIDLAASVGGLIRDGVGKQTRLESLKQSGSGLNSYLILPHWGPTRQSLLPISHVRMTPDARDRQIKIIQDAVSRDPTYREIAYWLKEEGVPQSQQSDQTTLTNSMTGFRVAQLTERQAMRLAEQVYGALVVPDVPLSAPHHPERENVGPPLSHVAVGSGPGRKQTPWHLKMIGATRSKKGGKGQTGRGIGIGIIDTGVGVVSAKRWPKIKHYAVQGGDIVRSQPGDDHDHGTPIAALILDDLVGAAPDAEVVSIRAIPCGLIDLCRVIEWVGIQPQIRILNISANLLTGDRVQILESLLTSLREVGILTVCPAGNGGRNFSAPPATCRPVLSVGALDRNKSVADYSSSGSFKSDGSFILVPDLVAPGDGVISYSETGEYRSYHGTSFAAALVTAAAARFLEKYPQTTVTGLIEGLLNRCKPLRDRTRAGSGIVYVGSL